MLPIRFCFLCKGYQSPIKVQNPSKKSKAVMQLCGFTIPTPRIRTLQQAPFADFAAEDLVQRSHVRAGGGGFEEAEET